MDPCNLDAELVSEMLSAMGKELKVARASNKEMQSQVQALKERAEAAEYTLNVMRCNFDATSAENHRLNANMEEMRDSKAWIKKEVTEETLSIHCEKSISTEHGAEPDPDHVQSLEEALELYYGKYKSQRHARNELRDVVKGLKAKISDQGQDYEELRATLEKERTQMEQDDTTQAPLDTDDQIILRTQKDVYDFMFRLPKPIDFKRKGRFDPVCLNTMDLKSYVAADPQLKEVAVNLLCLPGRILWCPTESVHGIALGPMYLYDTQHLCWSEGSAFKRLYGRLLHLFYTRNDKYVYYGGLFKAIDLRTQCPEGISVIRNKEENIWSALAEASTGSQGKKVHEINRTLAKLYSGGALRVEPLGLQRIGFDVNIYNTLRNRFTVVQSAMKSVKKRGAYYPEVSMEKEERTSKKLRID